MSKNNPEKWYKIEKREANEKFPIYEGEKVLGYQYSGATLNAMVLTEASGEWECGAEKADGEPCQKTVGGPNEVCHLHDN